MFNVTWTRSARRLVFTVVATAAYCWVPSAQAQVNEQVEDLGGIQLAPGETIIKSVDEQSGMPVPMFNAETNQPIVGSSVAGHSHAGHAGHSPTCGCSNCAATGSIGYGCFGGCEPGCYVNVESLLIRRQGDRGVTLSQNFALDEFDHEWGARITLGRTFDCVDGCEASFTGLLNWQLSDQRLDPGGNLNTLLNVAPPLVLNDINTFGNDVFQRQTYEAQYNSFDLSKTYNGWDVVRLLYGLRYIDYSEEYQLFVTNNVAQNGYLRSDVQNSLIGGQVGLDLGYPLGERCWSMLRTRGGLFANLSDSIFQVINNGTNVVANQDEATDLSGLLEIGTSLRYRLTDALSFSAGYELWYLANVATAPDQLTGVIAPSTGSSVNVGDDVFFHGAVLGMELTY